MTVTLDLRYKSHLPFSQKALSGLKDQKTVDMLLAWIKALFYGLTDWNTITNIISMTSFKFWHCKNVNLDFFFSWKMFHVNLCSGSCRFIRMHAIPPLKTVDRWTEKRSMYGVYDNIGILGKCLQQNWLDFSFSIHKKPKNTRPPLPPSIKQHELMGVLSHSSSEIPHGQITL